MDLTTAKPYRLIVVDDEKEVIDYYKSIFDDRDIDSLFSDLIDVPEKDSKDDELESIEDYSLQNYFEKPIQYHVDYFSQGADAVHCISDAYERGEHYSVAMIDIRMPPGIDGLETARQIRAIDKDIQLFIVTAYSDYSVEKIQDTLNDGVLFLHKPFNVIDILQFTANAIRSWEQVRSLGQMQDRLVQASVMALELSWVADFADNHFTASSHLLEQIDGTVENIQHFSDFTNRFHPEDRDKLVDIIDSGNKLFSLSHRILNSDGRYSWFQTKGVILYDSDLTPVRLSGITLAVDTVGPAGSFDSKLQDYFLALRDLTAVEPTSGMISLDSLKKLYGEHEVTGRSFVLFSIQLDTFEAVISQAGASAGSQLMQECISRIKSALEQEFTYYKFSADSFILYLDGSRSSKWVASVVDALHNTLNFTFSPLMVSVDVTAKVHAYVYPADSDEIGKLLG